jgi:hypothetical protein
VTRQAMLDVPAIEVRIGDRLAGQLVVAISHTVRMDECFMVTFSLAQTSNGPTTGTKTADGMDILTVDRTDRRHTDRGPAGLG